MKTTIVPPHPPRHHIARWILPVLLWPSLGWAGGVVTSCTETNLRAAMAGGGLVTFACDGTIALSKTLVLTQDVVLDATGHSVVISGANTTRVFRIQTNISFTARNLTIADGWNLGANGSNGSPAQPGQDGRGAGILNTGGTVTLIDCVLTNHMVQGGNAGYDATYVGNNAPGGRGMGAAVCNLGGTFNLTNCVLSGNRAKGGRGSEDRLAAKMAGAGGPGWGGAVFSSGGLVILDRVIWLGNEAVGGDPQMLELLTYAPCGDAAGGAVYLTNSPFHLVDCRIQGSHAIGGGPGTGIGLGGGLFISAQTTGRVERVTFEGNQAAGGTNGINAPSGAARGGAVFCGGKLQMSDSILSGNAAIGGGTARWPGVGDGGALCSTGKVVMTGCTFDRNEARGGSGGAKSGVPFAGTNGVGGGVYSSGVLLATNVSFSANRAVGGAGGWADFMAPGGPGQGGGICVAGGKARCINATLSENEALGGALGGIIETNRGPSEGGAVARLGGTFTLQNSIVANSVHGGDVWGILVDGGYNLCSDNTAQFSATGSLNNMDPVFGPLADNGGPTPTMALGWGSPAVDAVPCGLAPATDQRGVPRPVGASCDIGAFEGVQLLPPAVTTLGASNVTSTSATLNGSVNPNGSSTTAFFEWGPTTSYVNATTPQNVGIGFDRVPISAAIAGLSPGQSYHFRVVASNAAGASAGLDASFVCPPSKPTVATATVSSVTSTSAVFAGWVNPNGSGTYAWFSWQESGGVVAQTTPGQSLGAGTSNLAVTASVTGLQPLKTYDVWLVASNGVGISTSAPPTTFSTLAPLVSECTEDWLRLALSTGGVVRFTCDAAIPLSQTLVVTQNAVIDASDHDVTVSGGNAVRLFEVRPGVSLTLNHLVLTGGRSPSGAGLYNDGGSVTLLNCTLRGNSAVGTNGIDGYLDYNPAGPGLGGGLFNNGGTILASNTLWLANSATGGNGALTMGMGMGGGLAGGGAMHTEAGTLNLINCSLNGNTVVGGTPGLALTGGQGGHARGGALSAVGAVLWMSGVQVISNSVTGAGGGRLSVGGQGWGGGFHLEGGSTEIVGCFFAWNYAVAGPNAHEGVSSSSSGLGGAICNRGSLVVHQSTLATNWTQGGTGSYRPNGLLAGPGDGGAVFNGGTAEVSDCGFFGNVANGGVGSGKEGGGLTLPGEAHGGAVCNTNRLALVNCALAGNQAAGAQGVVAFSTYYVYSGSGGNSWGGAIFNSGVLGITNVTIANNSARGGAGVPAGSLNGESWPQGAGGSGAGGGICNTGTVALANVTLGGNGAFAGEGNPPGTNFGGGLYAGGGHFIIQNTLVAASVSGSNIFRASGTILDGGYNLCSDGSAQFSAPGSLNNVDPKLGPLADNGGGTPTMALLPGSPALDAGDPAICAGTDQRGVPRPQGLACDIGAVEMALPSWDCSEAWLRLALTTGGVVRFTCDASIVLTTNLVVSVPTILDANGHNVTLDGNLATRILQVESGVTCSLIGLRLINGSHATGGAGILNAGVLTLQGCTLSNNTLTVRSDGVRGGGVLNYGTLDVSDSMFVTNQARLMNYVTYLPTGGAIDTSGPLRVNRCTFLHNGLVGYGGAIRCYSLAVGITNCTFFGNTGIGAAIETPLLSGFIPSPIRIVNCTFGDHSSSAIAAGNDSKAIWIANSIVAGDRVIATDGGNNLFGPGIDARLGPLTNNGGPTLTMDLLPDSPAIDQGNNMICPPTDQRGLARPIRTQCDIGAIETTNSPAPAMLQFASATVTVGEGGTNAILRMIRLGNTGPAVSVSCTVTGGTAVVGEDYIFTNSIVAFGPGQTNASLSVPILNNLIPESEETVQFALSAPSVGAILGSPAAMVLSITDDDPMQPGTLQFQYANFSTAEGNWDALVTVIRTGGTNGIVTVDFTTSDWTATAGQDYLPTNGTLVFGDTEVSKSFAVRIMKDMIGEAPETLNLVLSNPGGGAVLGAPVVATMTVVDGIHTLTDCSEASLREVAISGGVVILACDGTIGLTSPIIINTNVMIDAAGHDVTISGSNAVRLFEVRPGVSLTLNHLVLADGRSTNGGGVLNDGGIVNLLNCTLRGNSATGLDGVSGVSGGGPGLGGGLFNIGGTIVATNTHWLANSARGGASGGAARGGAAHSEGGTVNLVNCLLSDNTATGGAGSGGSLGGPGGDARGGALSAVNATVWLSSVQVISNSASGAGGGRTALGGHGWGGALDVEGGSAEIEDCSFAGNLAIGGANAQESVGDSSSGQGGAICNRGALVLRRSTLGTNWTQGGTGSTRPQARPAGTGDGGALFNGGTAEALDCTFFANGAIGGAPSANEAGGLTPPGEGRGGAVCNTNRLIVVNCALAGNQALGPQGVTSAYVPPLQYGPGGNGWGGGIFNSGVLGITNATIADNSANGGAGASSGSTGSLGAGGAGVAGGIYNTGAIALVNVTLGGNGAFAGAGSPLGTNAGGGIYAAGGVVTIQNSIVANSLFGGNFFLSSGSIIDAGYNLCSDSSASFTNTGSLNNTDPVLGPLADNGGLTPTMALLPDSPAINAADGSSCPPTDQRGALRPQGAACDIGAYEASFVKVQQLQNGLLRLAFSGARGATCKLQRTLDWVVWVDVETKTAGPDGVVVFEVGVGSNPPVSFWRITSP